MPSLTPEVPLGAAQVGSQGERYERAVWVRFQPVGPELSRHFRSSGQFATANLTPWANQDFALGEGGLVDH